MCLLAVLKLVLVLLVNMGNILELSGLFVYQEELVKIQCLGDRKYGLAVLC